MPDLASLASNSHSVAAPHGRRCIEIVSHVACRSSRNGIGDSQLSRSLDRSALQRIDELSNARNVGAQKSKIHDGKRHELPRAVPSRPASSGSVLDLAKGRQGKGASHAQKQNRIARNISEWKSECWGAGAAAGVHTISTIRASKPQSAR